MSRNADKRSDFWAPFLDAATAFTADPDDGHKHDFKMVSPKSLGTFGPTCIACLRCGWIKDWGEQE